ncbi:MAG: PQQ-binding-like beta-propeller repeat protein [Planctomycetota bacterium]
MPVHAGAGTWASARLFELPPEGREVYRRRFEERARAALDRAVDAGDRGALTRLAERWPITRAAGAAWWALGDLEVERGHRGDALRAWARAAGVALGRTRTRARGEAGWRGLRESLAVALAEDDPVRAGALARVDFALEVLPTVSGERSSRARDEASFVRGPASGIAAARIDAGGALSGLRNDDSASEWPEGYTLPPTPFRVKGGAGRLFPQRVGDLVIVNTTRSVHALDAYDGTERWRLDASQLGWDGVQRRELFEYAEAVDTNERIVASAAHRGVVVAPVQIPVKFQSSQDFHDLKIIEVIPERRLVAFDARTGDPLWNTLPPPDWDGDAGTFAERMTVVGPPVIVGERVIVPMARLRGRVELHLGCFDLGTGDVLWSAPLVTGQRELNMFGRATGEFSAPPPVVAGDTVLMLTQLGIVAAVDLFTGEILWETLYEQVAIHGPQYYKAGWMDNAWRNAPPVVADGTVVAAPQDGRSLIGIDLESGSLLWSIEQDRIARRARVEPRRRRRSRGSNSSPMQLVGADDRHVYFGGQRVFSLLFDKGVRKGTNTGGDGPSPWRVDWAWPAGNGQLATEYGYPVLDEGSIFVPDGLRLVRLERSTGRELESIEGSIGSGQLLVSRGMLFAVNGRSVHGRFDWLAMVDRARERADKGDAADAAVLARLLLERARWSLDSGSPPREAVELAQEARAALERFAPPAGRSDGALEAGAGEIDDTLLRAVFLEARAERLRGGVERALELSLEAARLAEGTESALEARVVRYAILRERAGLDAQRGALADVLRAGRSRSLVVTAPEVIERWSPSDTFRAVTAAAAEGRSDAGALWRDPWRGLLTPDAALVVRDARGAADRSVRLTAEDFVALEEIRIGRALGGPQGVDLELEALHRLVQRGDTELFGTTLGLYGSARIQSLRAVDPAAFAAIDAAADAALEQAIAATRAGGDASPLERLSAHYPGSPASARADALRVEYALENGSAEEIAAIVIGSMPPDWTARSASAEEVSQLVKLGGALGRAGNRAFEAGLLTSLLRRAPDDALSEAGGREALEAALAEARSASVAPNVPAPRFTESVFPRDVKKGSHRALGSIVLERSGETLGLFASADRLSAVPTGAEGVERWSVPARLERTPLRAFPFADTVVLKEDDRLVALDAASGEERWQFRRSSRIVREVSMTDGVVVATVGGDDLRDPTYVYGVDAASGIELWRLGPIDARYHGRVVSGDGVAAFLPSEGSQAELHDLFTGHLVALAETGKVAASQSNLAWIEDGKLVVPVIDGALLRNFENAIRAFDLDTGAQEWRIDLDRVAGTRRSLIGLVDMPLPTGGRSHVALLAPVQAPRGPVPADAPAELVRIDVGAGALDLEGRVRLEKGESLVGVRVRRSVRLVAPLLVTVTDGRRGRSTRVRAYGPQLEERFDTALPRRLMTQRIDRVAPALGGGVLAMFVLEPIGKGRAIQPVAKLMFLDAETGDLLESRSLRGHRQNDSVELYAFGRTLAMARWRSRDIGVLELLESNE